MAVTAKVYDLAFTSFANKEIDWGTDTVKAMLCSSTYVPNQGTHQYKSSVTGEITGTGYTAGGVTLASKTEVVTTRVKTFDAADPSWTTATFTARYLVFYVSTGTDATSPLISYVDFGADVAVTASTFTYVIAATGIFTITVA